MSLASPVPVVLCGKDEMTGTLVTEHLKPEFEVIYFTADIENAKTDLALLLDGKPPQHPRSWNIGTGDYSRIPRAVILGSAYYAALRDSLRDAVVSGGHRSVPWIVSGLNQEQSMRAAAERVRMGTTSDYAKSVTRKIKNALVRALLDSEDKEHGLYFYLNPDKK